MLSPHCSLSIEDDESCAGLECDLFPSGCVTLGDTIDPIMLVDIDNIMFDQYLRSPASSPSPSPTPSADDGARAWSGATLIDTGRGQHSGREEPFKELSRVASHETEKQEAGYQEDSMFLRTALMEYDNNGPVVMP